MAKTKWLHISDMHMNKCGVDNEIMRQELLEHLQKNNIQCQYVFVTGDLRYAPEGDFADKTVSFLEKLCDSVGAKPENLFIVPGNHDVERDNPARSQAIDAVCGADGYYDARTGVIHSEDMQGLKAGRDGWYSIIEKVYEDFPERAYMYEEPDVLHFCVKTEHFNFVHLDSVLAYTKQKQRDLIVGTEQLMKVFDETDPTKTRRHLNYNWKNESEKTTILN